jgi:transaldolase
VADPLDDLTAAGVSIWLDDLDRSLLTTGTLHRLVEDRHVVGITSNPTIFANAIRGSADYSDQIEEFSRQGRYPARQSGPAADDARLSGSRSWRAPPPR